MFIPFCSCNNPTETPEKNVNCCFVLGISSFQGLKTYTPRKDSTNIWKRHVLPYHLLLQVPSRPIPANKASSAQSLVPFTMSDSCTVLTWFWQQKMFRVRSYDVVIMGPGRMGSYTNKAKQLGVSPCRNRVSKTHVWSGTVRQWLPQSQKIISWPKKTWYNQRITTNALRNSRNLHCSYKTGFPTSFTF